MPTNDPKRTSQQYFAMSASSDEVPGQELENETRGFVILLAEGETASVEQMDFCVRQIVSMLQIARHPSGSARSFQPRNMNLLRL